MSGRFQLRVCYVGRGDNEMQYLPPQRIEALDAAEAFRTAGALADFAIGELALKVLVLLEEVGSDDILGEVVRPLG